MKGNAVILVIIVNLLACLCLVIWYPHLMISPGNLLSGHQELTTECFSCHSLFIGSTPEKCIICHKVDDIGLFDTKGAVIEKEGDISISFHQELVKKDCVACHSDHLGVMKYRSIQYFSHELLNPRVSNNCDNCHQKPEDELHEKIIETCGQCHSTDKWIPAVFEHDIYFQLDRDHDVKCIKCHTQNEYSQYSCYECHEHKPSKIKEEHHEEGIYDYEKCTECHLSADEDEAKRLWHSKKRILKNDYQKFNSKYERYDHDDHDDDHDDD